MNPQRRALLGMGVAAPVAGGAAALAADIPAPAGKAPHAWTQESARETIRRHYFPDVVLRSHDGRRLRLYEDMIRGRVVTLNYMYIGCGDGTCPITTHNLLQVQRRLGARVGREVFMYSITLDPEIDTPEALRSYARQHDVGPGWLFLAPEPADAEMLRRRLGFYDRDPEADKLRSSHAGFVRVGNEPRQLWTMALGIVDPEVIVRAISWVTAPPAKVPQV
jgi:protein SCO1/2